MKTNLLNLLVSYLEKRGRVVRAGGDNLPKHPSVMLDNGPQYEPLRALLLSQPAELNVQLDGNRIAAVGLAAWTTEEDREVDEVPEGNDAMWAFALSTVAGENAQLKSDLARAHSDLEVAIELLSENTPVPEMCDRAHIDDAKLTILHEELANVRKQYETLRKTYEGQLTRYAKLAKENQSLESLLAKLGDPEHVREVMLSVLAQEMAVSGIHVIQLDGLPRTL